MSLTLEDFQYIKHILERYKLKDPIVVQRGGKLKWEEREMKFKLADWLRAYIKLHLNQPQWVGFDRADKLIQDKR